MNKPRHTVLAEDPNDEWARVELYRWQHGHLPGEPDHKPQTLDITAGIRGMADAIERGLRTGKTSHVPDPGNIVSVMRFAANLLEKAGKRGPL